MKAQTWLIGLILLSCAAFAPTQASYSSMYVFGDGACTTTNNEFASQYYYGLRRSNGRVWVEVLAQWQGIQFDSSKNWSYFGHDSTNLLASVAAFPTPQDAGSALFVIWCIDADLVWLSNWGETNIIVWTNALMQALRNHYVAVTNLYSKGARTLLMPNAVDVTVTPYYSSYGEAERAFIRQRVVEFNQYFVQMLADITSTYPDLKIYMPDFFWVTDYILTNGSVFGLTNALDENGKRIDALGDSNLLDKSLDGPGANYIFWDMYHPSARTHMVLADYAQRLLSPVRITGIASLGASNKLTLGNIPVGRNGFIETSTDLFNWFATYELTSTNITQTILVPRNGEMQFYRLRFPFHWTWP